MNKNQLDSLIEKCFKSFLYGLGKFGVENNFTQEFKSRGTRAFGRTPNNFQEYCELLKAHIHARIKANELKGDDILSCIINEILFISVDGDGRETKPLIRREFIGEFGSTLYKILTNGAEIATKTAKKVVNSVKGAKIIADDNEAPSNVSSLTAKYLKFRMLNKDSSMTMEEFVKLYR